MTRQPVTYAPNEPPSEVRPYQGYIILLVSLNKALRKPSFLREVRYGGALGWPIITDSDLPWDEIYVTQLYY